VTIEISKQARGDAVASIQRYFERNMPEPLGELPARQLLDFFLQEVGGVIYNKAIADAQGRMVQRVADLHGELFADEFQYWAKHGKRR
jgi:uncharacterized protein (DUF2164 family)